MGKIARGVDKINLPCCMEIIAIFLQRISLKSSLRVTRRRSVIPSITKIDTKEQHYKIYIVNRVQRIKECKKRRQRSWSTPSDSDSLTLSFLRRERASRLRVSSRSTPTFKPGEEIHLVHLLLVKSIVRFTGASLMERNIGKALRVLW